jgi:hypothetical protein
MQPKPIPSPMPSKTWPFKKQIISTQRCQEWKKGKDFLGFFFQTFAPSRLCVNVFLVY